MEKKNIGIKDLVNLGLFTAIYFVLFFIFAIVYHFLCVISIFL